ncbi:MAG: GNAT family N-acetyltransferase [Betaproteobacteria bacterium]
MEVPRDCDGVALVRSACFPAWPVSGDELAGAEARRPRDRLHLAWVAVQQDGIAAYGYVEEPSVAAVPGRIRIRVLVAPAHRGHGIGGSLFDTLLARALECGATELVTEAAGDDAAARRFLERRGFAEYHRRIESRLALADVEPATIGRGIEALTDAFFPSGVRIATYRQLLLAVPDAARRLYELDALLWADVPFGLTGAVPSFEQYQATELADPDFLPQATFVALDGYRWIGLGALMNGSGFLLNSMTGVAREWRGRGLARWLKLHTIRWALERNAPELRTFNDAVNEAILGLNRSLGFRPESVEVRYRKDVR